MDRKSSQVQRGRIRQGKIPRYSTYTNEVDRKLDRMKFKTHKQWLVFKELARQIIGWGGTSKKRWGWYCSPGYISKIAEVSYKTVERLFEELRQRKVITYDPHKWWEEKDRINTWVEFNSNLDEWIEDYE